MRAALLCSVALLLGCEGSDRPVPGASALPAAAHASSASRGEAAAREMASRLGLSTSVAVGEQVEERIGDGKFGPSDVVTYTVLSVAAGELLAWAPKAARLTGRPVYRAPKALPDWIGRSDFEMLEFYDASDLFPRTGWVGVARGRGKVYVMTMTN
jgi:hypothetical protein